MSQGGYNKSIKPTHIRIDIDQTSKRPSFSNTTASKLSAMHACAANDDGRG